MLIYIDTKSEDFAKRFIPQILRGYVSGRYNITKARKLNDYIKSLGIKSDVRTILLFAINNLRIVISGEGYTVEVDKNIPYPNTDFNISTLVKLITYGTVDVKGYDILQRAFLYVKKRILFLKKVYAAKTKKKED